MEEYSPKEVEAKWTEVWEREGTYRFREDEGARRMYILDMFPYPSGAGLHVGHLKGYLATDILTRFHTMRGCCVFHPMGWDAFGLPAEQYAIRTGNSPAEFTRRNIGNFRRQLKRLMLTYDFGREIDTSDPAYYQHTQWIFSEMYRRGLAKLEDTQVNWCPELNTVLSDEEIVDGGGGRMVSERGGHPVEVRRMRQWVLRITRYADELLRDIPGLEWPENVKRIQTAWIGATEGYEYPFRWGDRVYPLHLRYASSIRRLKGIGIHQFSELSQLLGVGPHNAGDREMLGDVKLINGVDFTKVPVYYLWNMDFRSDQLIPIFDGAEEDFYDPELERHYLSMERVPVPRTAYRLKDWVFSRQRFWGEPIPVLYDEGGNTLLDEELPVTLPDRVDYATARDGLSPLASDREWTTVVRGGKTYTRETSTMPNWAGSSWYFIAYLLRRPDGTYHRLDSPEAREILGRWLPVDIYVGGQEHAAMHLLYARFWHKFLRRLGVVECDEPFRVLLNQGMVLGPDGSKMSKSKGNCVSIDEIIDRYGADTLRVYEAFSGPTQLSFRWEEEGLRGSHRWLHRVHIFFRSLDRLEDSPEDEGVSAAENRLITNVEGAVPALKVNLGVSEMMIFLNELQRMGRYHRKALCSFVQILSLYAPALAEELWTEVLGRTERLFRSRWPTMSPVAAPERPVYRVFVNGKFRFVLEDVAPPDLEGERLGLMAKLETRMDPIPIVLKDVLEDKRVILVSTAGPAK